MPIVPGVMTVEALAQAGAVAILSQEEFKGRIAVFRRHRQVQVQETDYSGRHRET